MKEREIQTASRKGRKLFVFSLSVLLSIHLAGVSVSAEIAPELINRTESITKTAASVPGITTPAASKPEPAAPDSAKPEKAAPDSAKPEKATPDSAKPETAAPAAATPVNAMTAEVIAQEEIPLTEEYFPDVQFRGYISQFDLDGNGSLSERERGAVNRIEISEKTAPDLESIIGIEYFFPLESIRLTGCPALSEIDVSKNITTFDLDIRGCSIKEPLQLTLPYKDSQAVITKLSLEGSSAGPIDLSPYCVIERIDVGTSDRSWVNVPHSVNDGMEGPYVYFTRADGAQKHDLSPYIGKECLDHVAPYIGDSYDPGTGMMVYAPRGVILYTHYYLFDTRANGTKDTLIPVKHYKEGGHGYWIHYFTCTVDFRIRSGDEQYGSINAEPIILINTDSLKTFGELFGEELEDMIKAEPASGAVFEGWYRSDGTKVEDMAAEAAVKDPTLYEIPRVWYEARFSSEKEEGGQEELVTIDYKIKKGQEHCGTIDRHNVKAVRGSALGSLAARVSPEGGYLFAGWRRADGTVVPSLEDEIVTENTMYEAWFEPFPPVMKYHKVTFTVRRGDEAYGTVNIDAIYVQDGQKLPSDTVAAVPADESCRFDGWYRNGALVSGILDEVITGETVYEARFSRHDKEENAGGGSSGGGSRPGPRPGNPVPPAEEPTRPAELDEPAPPAEPEKPIEPEIPSTEPLVEKIGEISTILPQEIPLSGFPVVQEQIEEKTLLVEITPLESNKPEKITGSGNTSPVLEEEAASGKESHYSASAAPRHLKHECCILHFLLLFLALAVEVFWMHERRKHQIEEFEFLVRIQSEEEL